MKYVGDLREETPTIVVHFDIDKLNDEEVEFVKHRIWFVRGENKGFYSKILQEDILRYDKEVMKLVNSENDMVGEILQTWLRRLSCGRKTKL